MQSFEVLLRDYYTKQNFRYGTDIDAGLDKDLADELLAVNGPNCLVSPPKKSQWLILGIHLFGGFNLLLWIGVILTFVGYGSSYSSEGANAEVEPLYLGKRILTA